MIAYIIVDFGKSRVFDKQTLFDFGFAEYLGQNHFDV